MQEQQQYEDEELPTINLQSCLRICDKLVTSIFTSASNSLFPYNVQEDKSFDGYIEMLQKHGVEVCEKLKCGIFKLKNGLSYPGLSVTESVEGQNMLVAVPVELLLTSHKAEVMFSELREIFEAEEEFYHSGPIWQDRILVIFLLYLLKLKAEGDQYGKLQYNIENGEKLCKVWTEMGSNFSKQIDILSFWQESELNEFHDKSVKKAAEMERQSFQKQWKAFQQIQSQYEILQHPFINYANYRWIYTHAISRCFGSFMNSTYFVPFCQFFNHNCVSVSYSCHEADEFEQIVADLQNKQGTKEQESILEGENNDDGSLSDISVDSANSVDYIEEGDFSYYEVNSYTIKWCSKVSLTLKEKETAKVEQKMKAFMDLIDGELLWKGFSFIYIGQIIEKGNIVFNEYMAGRKKFSQAIQDLEALCYHAGIYRSKIKSYYEAMGCIYKKEQKVVTGGTFKQSQQQQQGESKEKLEEKKSLPTATTTTVVNSYTKSHLPPDKNYHKFTMQSHSDAHFNKNQQIYFEYGRLSNRTLLLRYGFCLEDNLYEHVWIRYRLDKELSQYPDLFNKVKEKGLPMTYQIKLKTYVLNTELIMLLRMRDWKMYVGSSHQKDFQQIFAIVDIDKQCERIDQIIPIYKKELIKYGLNQHKGEEEEEIKMDILKDLSESKGYHGYFIDVYNNEKIKILLKQTYLLQAVKEILMRFQIAKREKKIELGHKESMKVIMKEVLREKTMWKCVWGYLKTVSPFIQFK